MTTQIVEPPAVTFNGGALDDVAPTTSAARRRERWKARHHLGVVSTVPRARACGRRIVGDTVELRVTAVADGPRFAGLAGYRYCGSVWVCPSCSAKIAAKRGAEVERALKAHHARGGESVHVTHTMRHRKGQGLGMLWDALSYGWERVTSGKGWQTTKRQHGVVGYIRVVEITYGENGWHVHVHVLVLLMPKQATVQPPELDWTEHHQPMDWRAKALGDSMFVRWSRGLVAKGLRAPLPERGVHARWVKPGSNSMGDYFTKAQYELTGAHNKDAKHGGRTPWAILRSVVAGVERNGGLVPRDDVSVLHDLKLWHEYEEASSKKRRRQIVWSKGLRADLGLDVDEATDEDLANEDEHGEVLCRIERGEANRHLAHWRHRAGLLEATEADPAIGWALWLIERGCAFVMPEDFPDDPPED